MNSSSKEVSPKNLKKNSMYTIKQKGTEPIIAYFDKDESVKYLRFKNTYNTPLLVRKNSKFYYPHNSTHKRRKNYFNNNNNNKTRKYNKPKRVEFEPTGV